MPDGDLITADYQFQLHDTLYGRGSNHVYLDNTNIEQLLSLKFKNNNTPNDQRDGSFPSGFGMHDTNLVTIHTIIKASSEATVVTAARDLCAAWAPQTAPFFDTTAQTELDLTFQIEGVKVEIWGRPRGAEMDLSLLRSRAARVTLKFDMVANPYMQVS